MTFTPTSHPRVKNVFCFLSRKVYFANTVLVQSELLLRRLKAGDCLWSVLATETPPERRSPPGGSCGASGEIVITDAVTTASEELTL